MEPPRYPETHRAQIATASGLNVLAGAWLAAAPFVLDYGEAVASWNDVVIGSLVALIAAIQALAAPRAWWLSLVTAALGVWLLVAPNVLSYDNAIAAWNDRVLGVLILLLATWSAAASLAARRGMRPRPAAR